MYYRMPLVEHYSKFTYDSSIYVDSFCNFGNEDSDINSPTDDISDTITTTNSLTTTNSKTTTMPTPDFPLPPPNLQSTHPPPPPPPVHFMSRDEALALVNKEFPLQPEEPARIPLISTQAPSVSKDVLYYSNFDYHKVEHDTRQRSPKAYKACNGYDVLESQATVNKIIILCTHFNRLVELDIRGFLFQEIPAAIGYLFYLQRFYFTKANDLRTLPVQMGSLCQLRHLIIDRKSKEPFQEPPEDIISLGAREVVLYFYQRSLWKAHLNKLPDNISPAPNRQFQGSIFIWGMWDNMSNLEPRPLDLNIFHGMNLTQVACGGEHSAFLTDNGVVWTRGEGKKGALGTGSLQESGITSVPFLKKGIFIKQVCCGETFTVVLSDLGDVYIWGQLKWENPGVGKEYNPVVQTQTATKVPLVMGAKSECNVLIRPFLVKAIKRHFITQIAAGGAHILALTREGRVISWGSGRNGRLGRPLSTKKDSNNSQIYDNENLDKEDIFIEVYKKVHNKTNGNEFPTIISDLPSGISSIDCGETHSLAVKSNMQLYLWGNNSHLQCGNHLQDELLSPTLVERPEQQVPIAKAAAGRNATAFLLANGNLYCTKDFTRKKSLSSFTQVDVFRAISGIIPTSTTSIPTSTTSIPTSTKSIPTKTVSTNKPNCRDFLVDIALGADHLIGLTENGNVISMGSSTYGETGVGLTEFQTVPQKLNFSNKMTHIAAGTRTSLCFSGVLRTVLGEDLVKTLNQQDSFADVTFQFSDGKSYKAHACILACRSPVFFDYLTNLDNTSDIKIMISEFPSSTFFEFLEYLYSDRIKTSNFNTVGEIAKHYGVKRLVEYANFFLEGGRKNISETTFFTDFLQLVEKDNIITKKFSNVLFLLNDTSKIYSHKIFLCSRSNYFRAMFTGNMIESQKSEARIMDENISEESLLNLLRYFYTDKVTSDVNEALDMLPLVSQYDLERCRSLVQSVIEKEVDHETVAYVWQMAKYFNAGNLTSFCEELILSEFENVKQTNTWRQLSEEDKKHFFKSKVGKRW